MHPLTYQVYKSIPLLELEQFRHIEDRERLREIRALAGDFVSIGDPAVRNKYREEYGILNDQVEDDTPESESERHGRRSQRVFRNPDVEEENEEGMWGRRSQRDLALEAGLLPLLDSALTAEQRALVRLRYDARETFEQIGERLNITKQAVEQRFQTIHKRLRAALLLAYGPREESDEDAAAE